MRAIKTLFFFYRKIIIPALTLSFLLPLFAAGLISFLAGVGVSFVLLLPLFHYLGYEIRYPNEYYFYYNLGFSRFALWGLTVGIGLLVGTVMLLV